MLSNCVSCIASDNRMTVNDELEEVIAACLEILCQCMPQSTEEDKKNLLYSLPPGQDLKPGLSEYYAEVWCCP